MLKGGVICAFSEPERVLLYQLPLSRVNRLTCGNKVIVERHNKECLKSPYTLLHQLQAVMNEDTMDASYYQLTNDFELYFENSEKVVFHCESLEEKNKWVSVIEVMICELPELPEWIQI